MPNIAAFIGTPLNFKNKLNVFPPRIKDMINNPKFSVYQKILTMTQEDICDEFKKAEKEMDTYPTPYEFLLGNCYNSEEF